MEIANFSVKNGVLLNSFGKIFVPFKFRHKMLTVAHGCHHGISQTVERLRNKFFWPGLKDGVSNFVRACRTCSLVKPNFIDPKLSPMLT